MEPAQSPIVYKLILGHFRTVEIKPRGDIYDITIELPNNVYARSSLPFKPKLQVGDLLTLYTEVYPDAQTMST